MSSDWGDQQTIGELIAREGGSIKTGPFGTTLKASEYTDEGVPLISVREIGHGRFHIDSRTPRVSTAILQRLPEYILQDGDIVFARKGGIERCALVGKKESGWFLGSDGIRLRPPKSCDSRFLAYVLQAQSVKDWLTQNSTGSTMASLNQATIARLPIALPELIDQRKIADLLQALDDRITLLRETNTLLEQIAQTIFKSWFVDFDPVRAKQEGRMPEGMDEETAALFPDSFEESDLGMVPRGWVVRGIDESCDLGRGSSPRPIQKFMGDDVPWIKIADATASDGMFIFETKEKIITAGVKNSVEVSPGDLIMSNSASCGITVFVELNGCIHDGWLYFKNYRHISKNYLFFWLRKIAEHLVRLADGSVQKNLNIALVSSQKIICPPRELLLTFDNLVSSLLDRVRENCIQAQILANLRDTLLPRLISGKLRLPEAEEMIEGGMA